MQHRIKCGTSSIVTSSLAVILNNIPKHLMKNGQMISQTVLGSKTDKEVGACFWKIHANQPKFMIIFKHKTDRDSWHKNSSLLKDVMVKHGVRTTLVWYCLVGTEIQSLRRLRGPSTTRNDGKKVTIINVYPKAQVRASTVVHPSSKVEIWLMPLELNFRIWTI